LLPNKKIEGVAMGQNFSLNWIEGISLFFNIKDKIEINFIKNSRASDMLLIKKNRHMSFL
jgi:hypothetical protein